MFLLLVSILASLIPSHASLTTAGSPFSSLTPTLSLPYAKYQGLYNSTSDLNVFLGVRFAASTEGPNRWREAQPPVDERNKGWLNATDWPKQCPQSIAGGVVNSTAYSPLQKIDSEDCLFLNVYAPPRAKNLPVLVWIHGGGWDHNSVREFDATPMINFSNNTFISVTIQYRLGSFGFLQSPQMAPANGLNAGITDARAALKWVQDYIYLVGGDKDRVTIWGQSAGGGTVLHLVAAEAEAKKTESLFKGAVASSPYLTPMGNCNASFWTTQFHDFSVAANCTDDLDCLRRAPTDLLKTLNHQFQPVVQKGHPSAYEPCIEGPSGHYLKYNTAEQLIKGKVAGKYVIAGNNYNDGSGFASTSLTVPPNTPNATASSESLIAAYLAKDWPLTSDQIQEALSLYPAGNFADGHQRGQEIFQDAVFACPSNWLVEAFPKTGYRYLYAVADAVHARDNAYEFPIFYNTLSPYSPSLYASYIGSVISFVRSTPQSPNVYVPSSIAAEGAWPPFGSSDHGRYKVLNLTLDSVTRTNISTGYIGSGAVQIGLPERCDFWKRVRVEGGW